MKFQLPAAAFAGALMVVGGAHAATLVFDGTFSSPDTHGSVGTFSATQSGWYSLTGSSGVGIGSSADFGLSCISSGCQNLQVTTNTLGDVGQTINGLTIGQHYTLSYDYAMRPGTGAQGLDVLMGGQFLGASRGVYGAWTLNTFGFTATAVSEVLQFKGSANGLGGYGNEITNVSIATPEPASWAVMLLGFAVLGARSRRSRAAARA